MDKISKYLMTDNNLAHVTTYFILGCIAIYFAYQIIRFTFFRRTYKGIRFTTRNIAMIAIMAAVSATVTIVISVTIPITVFPPIRVAFEGIMIKIAGMFFGPIVGIIVGLITELLTMLFVPSYIHPAYFVMAIAFGFLSGIAAGSKKWTGNKRWITFSIINVFVIIYGAIMVAITNGHTDNVKFFGLEVSANMYEYVFIIILSVTLLLIWVFVFTLYFLKKTKLLDIALPIILLCVVTEFLSTTLIGSWGDSGFLGMPKETGGYISILALRLLESPIKVIFNTVILSTVYYVLKPLVKKD